LSKRRNQIEETSPESANNQAKYTDSCGERKNDIRNFKNNASESIFRKGEYLRGRQIAFAATLILGIFLLCYSLYIGVMIGQNWFGAHANDMWHMNNYFVIEGKYAYAIFGLATMIIGGLATGIAMTAFLEYKRTRKIIIILAAAFIIAITMTGLGFNTLDFMLGYFYWTNETYPPPIQVAVIGPVDIWNFYFFFCVVPLWTSGFLMGSASAYFSFIYKPLQTAEEYIAKRNLGSMLHPTVGAKTYLAESKAVWRSSGSLQRNFDNIN
jgi:hypothetical protein